MNKIEPLPWRGVRAGEKAILIALPLVAIAVMTLPFLDQVILRRLARLPGMRPVVTWLINGPNVWIVGIGLLLLFAIFAAFVHRRLVSNRKLWFGTGCPQCMERDLVRVSRQTNDRFYGLIRVPAYRYACRNCTWRGLRIARREHSPEHEAELEASLLRFDPDSVQPDRPSTPVLETIAENERALAGDDREHVIDMELEVDQQSGVAPDLEERDEPANHHDDSEPVDEMEWLWRRTSD